MENSKGNLFIDCDTSKCLGCKNCELACAVSHGTGDLMKAVLEGLEQIPRNKVISDMGITKAVQCRQCEEALCIKACPIDAIRQQDNMVIIDEDQCIGCRACVKACPYQAIVMSKPSQTTDINKEKRSIALKCNLCVHLEDKSSLACACIKTCPTKALALKQRIIVAAQVSA